MTVRPLLITALLALPVTAFSAPPAPAAQYDLLTTPLKDLQQKPRKIAEWKGKVLVVNFWATWCAPCREEIPEFIATQKQYQTSGVQFIGVAVDEPKDVARFAKQFGINYPLLTGEEDAMEIMRAAGNRLGGLPFTVIVDRQGKIVAVAAGRLPQAKLEAALKQVLGQASVTKS
ncbi:TlpA disulfide reductase family protein [Chitinivorax sp. PXF-14]|uniref:TlpA family protein disulfide reductase n=1 Tax=Chitinivorax sp. PXF-14 TaxID=3230488 RepID=UPI003465F57B